MLSDGCLCAVNLTSFLCQGFVREKRSGELLKTDGMRRPVSDGMLYAPKLSTRFEEQEIRRPTMKKISTAAAQKKEKVEGQEFA